MPFEAYGRCPMYPRTARRGQLCGGEELRDHGRDALRRARTAPGKQVAAASSPWPRLSRTTGAGDGGAHYPRSARRGQLCGGEGVPGIGKAQALPRTARSRPSCPLQAVTIMQVQKTTLHNRSSWVASTSLSMSGSSSRNLVRLACPVWAPYSRHTACPAV